MKVSRYATAILLLILLSGIATPIWSDSVWEYQVVILKGMMAGGTIEKQSSSIYIDTNKTEAVSALAADSWEVVAVVGAPGSDDTVYLRRKRSR